MKENPSQAKFSTKYEPATPLIRVNGNHIAAATMPVIMPSMM
jgi:hypothetical protein